MSPTRVRATAFLALLCVAEHADAGNLLRKPGQSAAASAADLATAQAAIAQAQQAAAAQAQAQGPLRRAREALQRFQAAQAAARLATRVQASAVPDGLAAGGLQVAAGAGQDPSLWQGAALPVASSAADGRTDVTITQQAPRAILTWDSFNVGARTHLAFDQSAGAAAATSWIVLNRVVDPTAQPSSILGSITAPGQVYLVNRNGIFFGGGAQVGASTLVVSGVDFTGALGIGLNPFAARDATFRQGLAQGTTAAATIFSGGGGAVTVSAGAELQAGSLGQVILVGSGTGGVTNQGAIAAPDGQVLLTAGEAVALQRAPDGRGYDLPLLTGGGLVENGGTLATRRGDITLVGGEVRQDGLISSTTGAKANGSVRILADGHVTFGPGSVTQILPDLPSGAETPQTVVGILDLGIDSTTGKDTRSQVQVTGRQIDLLQDASIYAPAGNVHLLAQLPAAVVASRTAEVDAGLVPSIADDTRVYLADGARIDVSGLAGVQLPMSRNTVEGELRAAELRDNPVLRDSPLRSRSVYFDPRQGVQVADLSGYVGLVARDVRELMTRGGDVSLAADAIVTRQGSAIDLSGGSLRYLDGTTRSSVLIDATGRRVAIEDAQPGIRYVGLDGDHVVSHARWGVTETFAPVLARGRAVLEPGYVQGSAAGSLTLTTADSITEPLSLASLNAPLPGLAARGAAETGRFRILDGDLIAATVVGPHQVTAPPAAASLNIDRSGDVTIAASAPLLGASTGPDSPLDPALQHQTLLPAGWFQGTLSSVRIKSGFWDDAWGSGSGSVNYAPGGHLTIPAGVRVDLGGRGSFSFTGKGVEIAGTLRATGGTLALQALDLPAAQPGQPELGYGALAPADLPTIHLAPTGILDASGDWTNERLDGASGARLPVSGGAIALTSTNLLLDTGSLLAVGGGARLDATGRTLTRGNGGSLALDVTRPYTSSLNPAIQTDPFYGRLVLGSTLEGYALGTGARITIATPYDVTIVGTPPADGGSPRLFTPGFAADAVAGELGADFFTRGGFASFALVAERGITLTAGTVLHPSTETLVVPERLAEIPGGTRFADFAPRQVLPLALRQPMSLSLSTAPVRPISADFGATPGAGAMDLVVEAGARLELDTGSSVALSATGTLYVDGIIQASAGSISLTGVDPFLGKSVGLTRIGPASVRLGPEARLLVPGATQVTERGPLEVRSVLPGGKIALAGNEVMIDQAAVLDASGVAGVADLPAAQGSGARGALVPVAVDGAAGSISVSTDGGLLAGQLRLGAGGSTGAGGSLSVTYASRSGNAIPLVVTPTVPAGTATVGRDSPAPRTAGSEAPLVVAADALRGSGADALTLATAQPGAPLLFDGDVTLAARRSLVLGTAVLGVRPGAAASDVQLDAGYVRISGVSQGNAPAPTMTTAATSHLTVQADDIDVMGSVSLGCAGSCQADGFATAHLGSASTTDLRLSDHDATGAFALAPGLRTAGALELQAAQVYAGSRLAGSQLYGDRAATDPGFLVSSPVSITIQGNDLPAATPLSFGERLTVRAPVIQQGGVLRAPQGQLRLEGWAADGSPTGSITLLPGSITSASLGGALVPFAAVGSDGTFLGYDTPGAAPTKAILLDASSLTVASGAVVDVSGGGDVRGFNFTSGNGGSRDVLASGGYAILPGVGQGLAPLGGAASFNDATLAPGAAVRLLGVPGLADGWYTLLPAHDALLPGGLLVQPAGGGSAAPLGTAVRDDGALVVSGQLGYRVAGGAYVADAPLTRFVVMPRSVYGQYSALRDASLTATALALAGEAGVRVRTPLDAGGVALRAGRIDLLGTGRFGGAPGGLSGSLDIAADQIAVTTVAGEAPAGALVLDPRALEAFGAGSLLLGGTRTDTATGTQVEVRAQRVLVDTAGVAPLTLPEIVLVATGDVTIAAGSSLHATGAAPAGGTSLQLQGDGALLRLSSADRVDVLRSGAAGATGQVILGAGSTLAADGSLSLDASRQLGIAPDAVLTALQLDLSATRLNLGDAPTGTPGTTLGSRALSQLASASQLLFRAPEIDLFGSLSIGGTAAGGAATLGQLTLDAGLVQGQAGPATLTAGVLALQNSTGAAPVGAAGNNALTLQVGRLTLGPGDLTLAGYSTVGGSAGLLQGVGHGSLTTDAAVTLAVGEVTAASGADSALRAGSALTLNGGVAGPAVVAGLGGRLALEGDAVRLDTSFVLPAGSLQATARTGTLEVGPTASIQVGGRIVDFRGVEKVAPAGTVSLSAATDLHLLAGSTLDVSGTAHGGDAGAIQLTAGGTATLDGTLVAANGGGSFSVDAARLGGGFEALGAAVEGARGFDAVQRYRLRGPQEDLTLAAGRSVTAHQVSLISDGGAVTVAGTIAAAGSQAAPAGGRIELSGGAGVALGAGAALDARAATVAAGDFQPSSGAVLIEATGGRVDVAPGATIDLGGGRQGGGTLVVRAPRDGVDVAVDRLGARLVGAREVVVQGVATYGTATVDQPLVQQLVSEGSSWLLGSTAMSTRLGVDSLLVGAGARVRSTGDLDVATDLALSGALGRGFLALVAGRDLLVNASLSDGFAEHGALDRRAALLVGPSSTFSLSAGRDLVLGANTVVRTGTGDLGLTTGRDLILYRGVPTAGDLPATVYSAGRHVALSPGFLGAPSGMPLGEFPVDGGDVRVEAGRDVANLDTPGSRTPALPAQTTSAWLYRYGGSTWNADSTATVRTQTSWSVVLGAFNQGLGALGGGDVSVTAGRDVLGLEAALPTTGQLATAVGATAAPGDLTVRGGGDLTVRAGGDIQGGLFVLGRGQARLRAGGSLLPGVAPAYLQGGRLHRPVGLLLGLMDATASLTAGGDVAIEGIFDPMLQAQVGANLQGGSGAAFWSFTDRTAVDATAVSGDLTLQSDPWATQDLASALNGARLADRVTPTPTTSPLGTWFARSPGSLRLAALEGSVLIQDAASTANGLTLASAGDGQLELLARQDVVLALKKVAMDEVQPSYHRDATASFTTTANAAAPELVASTSQWRSDASTNQLRGFGAPLHADDPTPARIYALDGSICAYQSGACAPDTTTLLNSTAISLPKALEAFAGTDLLAGAWSVQHSGQLDTTVLQAGRDVYDAALTVSGDGLAVVEAGRDVRLHLQGNVTPPPVTGARGGLLQSVGNARNPALPAGRAAAIEVLAGASGLALDAFEAVYLDPTNARGVPAIYLDALRSYLQGLGLEAPPDPVALRAALDALPAARRRAFLLDAVLFPELQASGQEYNDSTSRRFHSYDRGLAALGLLIPTPNDSTLHGDIILNGKPVETQALAGLTLLAPHGRIAVGSEAVDTSSGGGVVTRRGGDIHLLAQGNVDLYTSRVFTLQGGNILIWSNGGSITAGAGAKTAVRDVPLQYTMSTDGVVTLDVFGLQTGAGIGVLDALQGGDSPATRSRLDLIAPTGEVNAGDAGIRSVGDLNIAAQVVVGSENIQVGGKASGVPHVEAPSVGALTAASQLKASAATEGVGPDPQAAQRTLAQLPSIITVEVIGYDVIEDDQTLPKKKKKGADEPRK